MRNSEQGSGQVAEHRCGWVALMGPPNAGKSTLLNTYLGQKVAIVTPKPQTTRNQISGILSDNDAQVIFLDTPGVHQLKGKMNRMLLQSAWQAMSGADMILVILDADQYLRKADLFETDLVPLREVIAREKRPVAVAVNKVDMFHDKARMLPLLEKLSELWPQAEIFPVSALHGQGMPELLKFIKRSLPVAPAQYPAEQLSTVPLKFMAAEIIREKLFLSLKQEIPYYTAVEIERWEDKQSAKTETPLTVINAVVYVGRTSHKGMVIGKGGAKLKEISSNARKDIEDLLGHKVFLEVWVKVREGWSEDSSFLQFMTQASDELMPAEGVPSIEFGEEFSPEFTEELGEDFDPGSVPAFARDFLAERQNDLPEEFSGTEDGPANAMPQRKPKTARSDNARPATPRAGGPRPESTRPKPPRPGSSRGSGKKDNNR